MYLYNFSNKYLSFQRSSVPAPKISCHPDGMVDLGCFRSGCGRHLCQQRLLWLAGRAHHHKPEETVNYFCQAPHQNKEGFPKKTRKLTNLPQNLWYCHPCQVYSGYVQCTFLKESLQGLASVSPSIQPSTISVEVNLIKKLNGWDRRTAYFVDREVGVVFRRFQGDGFPNYKVVNIQVDSLASQGVDCTQRAFISKVPNKYNLTFMSILNIHKKVRKSSYGNKRQFEAAP